MTVCVPKFLLRTIGSFNHYFYELNLIPYSPMQNFLVWKNNIMPKLMAFWKEQVKLVYTSPGKQ